MVKKYQSSSSLFWRRAKKRMQGIVAFFRAHWLGMGVFLVSIAAIFGLGALVLHLLSGPRWALSNVNIQMDEVAQLYHYQPIEQYLRKDFEGVSKIQSWINKRSFFPYYKARLPWIFAMRLEMHGTGAAVSVQGRVPNLYIESQGDRFALVNASMVDIQTPKQLGGTGMIRIPEVHLAESSSSGNQLHGLFYGMEPARFTKQVQLITDNMEYDSLEYIPGAQKMIMKNKQMELYFDLEKNVIAQLDKYKKVIANGLLQNYRKLDLGTMDDSVFMSR